MLRIKLALAGAFAAVVLGVGFSPARASDDKPTPKRLAEVLAEWQKQLQNTETAVIEYELTEDDLIFQQKTVRQGAIKFRRPGCWSNEFRTKDKPDSLDKFVKSDKAIFLFKTDDKTVHVLRRPLPGWLAWFENFFKEPASLVCLVAPERALNQFDFSLAKEDRWYIHLDLIPKTEGDRVDFIRARLVLSKETFLPRQFWYELPNKDTVTWNVTRFTLGANPDAEEFTTPAIPRGWKLVELPQSNDK